MSNPVTPKPGPPAGSTAPAPVTVEPVEPPAAPEAAPVAPVTVEAVEPPAAVEPAPVAPVTVEAVEPPAAVEPAPVEPTPAEALRTELEAMRTELEAMRTERDQAARTALITGVAAEKGVPAHLLTGTTREELEATADSYLSFAASKAVPPKTPSNDAAASGLQGTPISAPRQLTLDEVRAMKAAPGGAAAVDAARKQGLLKDILQGA